VSTERAKAFTNAYSTLRYYLELSLTHGSNLDGARHGLGPRVNIQQRVPGTPQTIRDAAIYILNVPAPATGEPSSSLPARVVAELKAHLGVLRGNGSATLVLVSRVLPEHGTVGTSAEASARLRDLSLLQLANERELQMSQLIGLLSSVKDSSGQLVLVNKLRPCSSVTVALEIRYQAYVGH
jgi:hypothetical protein